MVPEMNAPANLQAPSSLRLSRDESSPASECARCGDSAPLTPCEFLAGDLLCRECWEIESGCERCGCHGDEHVIAVCDGLTGEPRYCEACRTDVACDLFGEPFEHLCFAPERGQPEWLWDRD